MTLDIVFVFSLIGVAAFGRTLKEAEFRSTYDLHVIGIRRGGQPLASFKENPIQTSDSLLVVGAWSRIRQLQTRTHDFVVLEIPREIGDIAIYAAYALEISPYPFAVAVLIAASCAYSTPVSTPVVTLVVDPGGYKFSDFVKVGIPLFLLSYLTTMLVAPLAFPFLP